MHLSFIVSNYSVGPTGLALLTAEGSSGTRQEVEPVRTFSSATWPGYDIRTAQKLLGHSEVRTTLVILMVCDREAVASAARLTSTAGIPISLRTLFGKVLNKHQLPE